MRTSVGIALALMMAGSLPVLAEDLDMAGEVRAAMTALDDTSKRLGGMGGLGAIPEDDLQTIQGILGEGERLIREARRRAQAAATPQDQAWAIAYARAGRGMVDVANEYRAARGYQ